MHPHCLHCRLLFEREPGYFIGAMYVNYGFTVLVAISVHFVLKGLVDWPLGTHVALAVVIAVGLPLATFRHARSLWLAMDFFFDPPKERPRSIG